MPCCGCVKSPVQRELERAAMIIMPGKLRCTYCTSCLCFSIPFANVSGESDVNFSLQMHVC